MQRQSSEIQAGIAIPHELAGMPISRYSLDEMIEFGQIIGVVFGAMVVACLMIFIFSLICALFERLRDQNADPYEEGRLGYWKYTCAKAMLTTHTIGGFRIAITLTATLERVDDAQFKASQMLDEDNWLILIKKFGNASLEYLLAPNGTHFFAYGWFRTPSPGVLTFVVVQEPEQSPKSEFDPNGCSLVDAINERTASTSWRSHGCKVSLLAPIERHPDVFLEENHSMISPREHAMAEQDAEYLRMQEITAIKALMLQRNLAEIKQEYRAARFTLTSTIIGTTVIISWQLHKDVHKDGGRLLGFRKEGGYFEDGWDETGGNGTRVIESREDTSFVDYPRPGETHFYTFFLMSRKTGDKYSPLRCAVHVPEQNYLAMLKALLDRTHAEQGRANAKLQKRAKVLDKINFAIETHEILLTYRKQKIAQVNADTRLNAEEKKDLIDAINAEIDDAPIPMHE